MKKIAVVLLASLLAGCAAAAWKQSGRTQAQQERDLKECDYEAMKATAGSGSVGLAGGISDGLAQSRLIEQCMELRGYRR